MKLRLEHEVDHVRLAWAKELQQNVRFKSELIWTIFTTAASSALSYQAAV